MYFHNSFTAAKNDKLTYRKTSTRTTDLEPAPVLQTWGPVFKTS